MAKFSVFINPNTFNLKFKNYFRDFYIYQFKKNEEDYKIKTRNDENGKIPKSTYYDDLSRLRFALSRDVGIEWTQGKKQWKQCITIDSKDIQNNPFFKLYYLSNERTNVSGDHFELLLKLFLCFNQGSKVTLTNHQILTDNQLTSMLEYLNYYIQDIYADKKHTSNLYVNIPLDIKQSLAPLAINKFYNDKDKEITQISNILNRNYQKIEYEITDDKKLVFKLGDSTSLTFAQLLAMFQANGMQIGEDQFENIINSLIEMGLLKKEKKNYLLTEYCIGELFDENEDFYERFCQCISYFSETTILGEIGDFILKRLKWKGENHIYYKHHYLKNALNDYNNIDILYAIKNKLWMYIEYRNSMREDMPYQTILCYPIELRENVSDGRQYLIYYHPTYRSISAIRIEFIDSIRLGEYDEPNNFNNDIKNAKILIEHTWGTSFEGFKNGNVKNQPSLHKLKMIVSYDRTNESFMKQRLEKESRGIVTPKEINRDEIGSCLEICAEICDPKELTKWLRSYFGRIVEVTIDDKSYTRIINDTSEMYKLYNNYSTYEDTDDSDISPSNPYVKLEDEFNFKKERSTLHMILFNEIYSVSFMTLGKLLYKVMIEKNISDNDLKEYQDECIKIFSDSNFTEKKKEYIKNYVKKILGKIDLFLDINNNSIFTFKNTCNSIYDLISLTKIERQWISNIMDHPHAQFFLEDEEITKIKNFMGTVDLFDINDVVYRDYAYTVRNENDDKKHYIFRKILKALNEKCKIKIKYKRKNGKESSFFVSPAYIEFSKRDNMMRLQAVEDHNRIYTFNLDRIIEVNLLKNQIFDRDEVNKNMKKYKNNNQRYLDVNFTDIRGVPDRILTEFSCYRKTCEKWANDKYHMRLFYDNKDDPKEILIRLMGYGPYIYIYNDEGSVRSELIKKLERQLEIFDIVMTHQEEREIDL